MVKDLEKVITEYKEQHNNLENKVQRIETLISQIINSSSIKIHFIESRAKSISSYIEKINRPNKNYSNPIDEITDILGIRIVLYYQDDIPKICNLLKKEFNVIEEELNHQQDKYSVDTFGYLSVHLIASLNKSRLDLAEWQMFKSLKFEVQIRTVLQHSWAAISHVLQYKKESDVPNPIKRKLYRLASLFELADEQFINIRDDATLIKKADISNKIKTGKEEIMIDSDIVEKIITTSEELSDICNFMKEINFEFSKLPNNYIGDIVDECKRLKINKINEIKDILSIDYTDYMQMLKSRNNTKWTVSKSFVLYLILIANRIDDFSVEGLIEKKGWGRQIAELVIDSAINFRKI